MDNQNKQLIAWLNDAYSMERSLIKVLENHVNDAEDYPEIKSKFERHLAETRQHAEKMEKCLNSLGEKPSFTKRMIGSALGAVQGISTGAFSDELIKNFLSDYSAEHLEIASYCSLIAAAEKLDLPEIARTCEGILREEEAMASWLEDQIPILTQRYLQEQPVGR